MLRYLPGLLLVQLATLGLFALNAGAELDMLALRAGVPALVIALLAALWFRSLSRVDGERDLARSRLEHERERERLRQEAARERDHVTKAAAREREDAAREAARTVQRAERRTSRRANLKVGLAFAAVGGIGVLFVMSQLLTLGVLTLASGGGALGGYLLRWRQTRAVTRVLVDDERRGVSGPSVPPDGTSDANVVPRLPAPDGHAADDDDPDERPGVARDGDREGARAGARARSVTRRRAAKHVG